MWGFAVVVPQWWGCAGGAVHVGWRTWGVTVWWSHKDVVVQVWRSHLGCWSGHSAAPQASALADVTPQYVSPDDA